jgi:hypothetical protein
MSDRITIHVPSTPLPSAERVSALSDAFDRVKNAEHWKGPIRAHVTVTDEADVETILDAIEFYTATAGTATLVESTPIGKRYLVTAPGYWAGPAN